MENVKAVSLNEQVRFRCQLCGGCCHYVKDSIMLEPMDIYRLARYLREQGEPVTGTEDVLAEYAHASWLEGNFPIFVLNTESELDVCTFLKDGRCRVYEARPHVCRMYPFSAAPGSRGRDFQYLLCTEKPHHFADGIVTVKDWLSQNFSKETKAILKADYDALPVIGQNIRAMSVEQFKKLEESIADLKDPNKDCSCTPDSLLAEITEFVKKFYQEIEWFHLPYYEGVFPMLSQTQFDYLCRQMDSIHTAADQLTNHVKKGRVNAHGQKE